MTEFSDILYSRIEVPDWLLPFIRLPEFVRLRGVRLSNVDSYQFKDFNGPTRWEHGIAVAFLAIRCGTRRGLSQRDLVHLTLAALLHDVATPPFAHTAEYVLEDFDHELETQRLLTSTVSDDTTPDMPVFGSQLSQFGAVCRSMSKKLGFSLDLDEISQMVVGKGELGFLIAGTLDLDNADNVTRASLYVGIDVARSVPLALADWLADQNSPPLELTNISHPAVQEWLHYRRDLYSRFFESNDQELGRQAFLQHLMRRALRSRFPRHALIWNTDEGLLNAISSIDNNEQIAGGRSLHELVQSYRLLEPTLKFVEVGIEDEETLRSLRLPQAATWIEDQLSTPHLEAFVVVSAKRFSSVSSSDLLPPVLGLLAAYKVGGEIKHQQLPPGLRHDVPAGYTGVRLRNAISETIRRRIQHWVKSRPWLSAGPMKRENIVQSLDAIGDWSFRLSRNESLHAYPGTFVHAIPASLINCLGIKGELVVDPFGGTGQTAAEVVKYGGTAVSADSSSIATLAARAKLTYLDADQRALLRALDVETLQGESPVQPPTIEDIHRWHDPRTLEELCCIKSFILRQEDSILGQFLTACFSSILPTTTGRKGKQHGFFADNTPLARNERVPPYENAFDTFVAKVRRNLDIIERLYAFIEGNGRDARSEMARCRVVQTDATLSTPRDYQIAENAAAAIITSPPYLCMADYTLGQRLSYYWIYPEKMKSDFESEVGSRRSRNNAKKAVIDYLASIQKFASRAQLLVRPGGFLATVLGSPVASAFSATPNLLDQYDSILADNGFHLLWSRWRRIHWHRNHGYQRLREERISVHVFDKRPGT